MFVSVSTTKSLWPDFGICFSDLTFPQNLIRNSQVEKPMSCFVGSHVQRVFLGLGITEDSSLRRNQKDIFGTNYTEKDAVCILIVDVKQYDQWSKTANSSPVLQTSENSTFSDFQSRYTWGMKERQLFCLIKNPNLRLTSSNPPEVIVIVTDFIVSLKFKDTTYQTEFWRCTNDAQDMELSIWWFSIK